MAKELTTLRMRDTMVLPCITISQVVMMNFISDDNYEVLSPFGPDTYALIDDDAGIEEPILCLDNEHDAETFGQALEEAGWKHMSITGKDVMFNLIYQRYIDHVMLQGGVTGDITKADLIPEVIALKRIIQ